MLSFEHTNTFLISCVMKSGGDFSWDHVRRLKIDLDKHLTLPFILFVLSDQAMPEDLLKQNCQLVFLRHNWPGWWSKIELFRVFSKSFYFDLDTAIVGNINHLISFPHRFSALRGFYGRPFGSGLMAWNKDFNSIYEEFKLGNSQIIMDYFKTKGWGDQEFIGARIKKPLIFQDQFKDEIVSYKIHVQGKKLPKNVKIVCFHGKPRIQDVRESWLEQKMYSKSLQESQLPLF